MKKIITSCLLAFLFSNLAVTAQFKQIAQAGSFEEPEDGVSRVIQMKNGNTFYLHVTEKDGVDLRVYSPDHMEKVSTSVIPGFGRLKAGAYQAAFEIKGDIVLFVSEFVDRAPILYRLIFDGNTGKLKEEKTIASMKGYKGIGMLNTGMIDAFTVKKDAGSDNYAVEICYFFEDDKDKRIEIVQYDEHNNEVSRHFLTTPDDDDNKWFVYMDMEVLDANRVNLVMYNGKEKYFYNTKKGRLMMASVDRNSPKVTYTVIEMPEERMKFSRCSMKYIPKTKQLYLMVLELNEKDRDNYNHYLVSINTTDNKMSRALVTDVDEKLNAKYKEHFSLKKDYIAMYRNFEVKEDGSYTVIYEEQYSSTSQGFGKSYTSYFTGKIMVMNYNSKGEVVSGYVIPKLFSDNYFSNYKFSLYLDNGKNRYMIINDTERNNDAKKDKYITIEGVSDCDAFYYNLSGEDIVPKREMLFGSNTDGHNLAPFRVSDYNGSTNTLVTLKLRKKSPSDKAVSLVWLQPQ